MKTIYFTLTLLLMLASGIANAQTGTEVYSDGNVRIIQQPDGWRVTHGKHIVAHGDGVLPVKKLPPAFQDFLDYYAQLPESESPKPSLSKSTGYTYGPLIQTHWNQHSPYNDLCPTQLVLQANGTYKEERTLAGCVQISSAQIINYYKFLLPLRIMGDHEIKTTNEYVSISNEFNLRKVNEQQENGITYYYYDHNIFNYIVDFDKINSDNYELAKFIYALGLIQKASFGVDGTASYSTTQSISFIYYYGYRIEHAELSYISENDAIENYIKKGQPVLVDGISKIPDCRFSNNHLLPQRQHERDFTATQRL